LHTVDDLYLGLLFGSTVFNVVYFVFRVFVSPTQVTMQLSGIGPRPMFRFWQSRPKTAPCDLLLTTPHQSLKLTFYYFARVECWTFITLRAKLSGAVYCYRSCLWVCLFLCVCGPVTTITRNCVHRSSPNWVCR